MEPFEHQSYWWLPENVESKHSGTLSFCPENGLQLETPGSFSLDGLEPGQSKPLGIVERYPIIKGATREGKFFTLFDCDSGGLSIRAPGLPSQIFTPIYAFKEETPDLEKEPPRTFYRALVQFTYLADWVGASGIRQSIVVNDEAKRTECVEITYKLQDKIIADLGQAKVSIVEDYKSLGTDRDIRGICFHPHFSLEIKGEQKFTYEKSIRRFIGLLKYFLTLDTRRSSAVTNLSLYSKQNQTEMVSISKASPTTIYYKQPVARKSGKDKPVDIRNMLFGFRNFKDELEQILQTWFSKRERFESTKDLFFAVENLSRAYSDNGSLNLAQALQVYHRKRFVNWVIPKSDFKVKQLIILESAPEEHREWLTEQLTYANQRKLHHRLLELLGHTQSVISKLVSNKGWFARKVTDTQNFLTHFSRKRASVVGGKELYRATQVLSYIIQTYIMLDLGISEKRIVALFNRNQKFLFTVGAIKRAHYWG